MNPIPPGIFCVPAIIVGITGADLESVVYPSLNRNDPRNHEWLHGPVNGVHTHTILKVLEEMGWQVRRYRDRARRSQVMTWAKLSKERWPGEKILLLTNDHALAVEDGLVYDTFTPYGGHPERHSFRKDIVILAALVRPGPKALGRRA